MPENVTRAASDAASAGPTPATRSNPLMDPNGPLAVRSDTMRRASTGPIRGNDSISAAVATSRSTGAVRAAGGEMLSLSIDRLSGSRTHPRAESAAAMESARDNAGGRRDAARFIRGRLRPPPAARVADVRAESTDASWRASA